MRSLAIAVLVVLAACSPSFSTRVAPFETPIANTLGRICWTRVDAGRAPPLRTATFRATASYRPDALLALTDRVELQAFGRRETPGGPCTDHDARADVVLSEPFVLEREVAQPIAVGGPDYGTELADLVNAGTFWLGVSAAGNLAAGPERVRFDDGRITVGF